MTACLRGANQGFDIPSFALRQANRKAPQQSTDKIVTPALLLNFLSRIEPYMPIANEKNLVFYKYMSPATAHAVLGNQTLRWSTPGTLNDPYDMQFDLKYEVDRGLV